MSKLILQQSSRALSSCDCLAGLDYLSLLPSTFSWLGKPWKISLYFRSWCSPACGCLACHLSCLTTLAKTEMRWSRHSRSYGGSTWISISTYSHWVSSTMTISQENLRHTSASFSLHWRPSSRRSQCWTCWSQSWVTRSARWRRCTRYTHGGPS